METAKDTASIKDYLMAGIPCLFLSTVEEAVAERRIREALLQLDNSGRENTALAVWKITTGMRIFPHGTYRKSESTNAGETGPKELVTALQHVEKSKTSMVAIFYHIRHFLNAPNVIQQIIDTVDKARLTYSTIIFVGPYLELPPELHDVITYCECPLPTRKELAIQFTELVEAYKDDLGLDSTTKDGKEIIQRAATAASGLTTLAAENAAVLSLAMTNTLDHELIQKQKEQDVKKSEVLEFVNQIENINTIGGFDVLKTWLVKRKKGFSDEAQEYGLKWPKGIMLVGAGGTGKSHAGKVIASYLNLPLLRLDIGKVFNSLLGSSENRLRNALKVAEALSPAVVLVDEFEKGLAGMNASGQLDSGVTARVVATLLTWRQETTAPVFMVATVNDPRNLPPMVYRKGRFDEIWSVALPTKAEREEIFAIHLQKRKRDPKNFDLNVLALRTDKFTGAEIESCLEDAMFSAFYDDLEVTTEHILDSIKNTSPQNINITEESEALDTWMKTYARSVSSQTEETINNVRSLKKGDRNGNSRNASK